LDRGAFTNIKTALQLLSDSHELNSGPEIRTVRLRDAECPAATVDVATIFPDGLEALLEQIYRLSHLNLLNGSVIVIPPKVLHTLDLVADLL